MNEATTTLEIVNEGPRPRVRRVIQRQRLITSILVKVYLPGEGHPRRKKCHADPGFGFSEENITELIEGYAKDLRARFPEYIFDCARIGPGEFNFVARPAKEMQ